jgi:energy-coupling factor transport system permease protein
VRFHPAAWMCWATCGGLVAFTTTNPFYLGVLVAVAWFVYATQRIPGPTARAFRVFAIGGLVAMALRTLLVVFGTVDAGTVVFAALEGARVAALLIVFGTFNAVTDPFGVVRLAPRRFHEPALAAALALSIAPRTIAMAGRVREAQRLRGLHRTGWRSLPALAVPVLETGMEEAVTLAESMDARGHGRGRRTRYRPARWNLAAVAVTATALLAACVFMAAAWTGQGGLHPSTSPLAWPAADPVLLIAIVFLALPGVLPRQRDDAVPDLKEEGASPEMGLLLATRTPRLEGDRPEAEPVLPLGGRP